MSPSFSSGIAFVLSAKISRYTESGQATVGDTGCVNDTGTAKPTGSAVNGSVVVSTIAFVAASRMCTRRSDAGEMRVPLFVTADVTVTDWPSVTATADVLMPVKARFGAPTVRVVLALWPANVAVTVVVP